MKLDSDGVWTVSRDHLRLLEAAERLSKTHEYIPIPILKAKAGQVGNFQELAYDLIRLKFLTYRDKMYKISVSGNDCLAINALRARGLQAMGSNIGIGKESDIYIGRFKGVSAAIKIHRLGRTSYQRVSARGLRPDSDWYEMNKENCHREAEFMRLFEGLAVPRVLDKDRHVLVMELLDYAPMHRIRLEDPEPISRRMLEFIRDLWERGYVHGDFNEFNVMVKDTDIMVVDFPQCVSKDSPQAAALLQHDIECVFSYFWKKHFFCCDKAILAQVIEESGIQPNLKGNKE